MSPLRFLGFCGLASSILSGLSGFLHNSFLLGCAGLVMTAGNLVAIASDRPAKGSRRDRRIIRRFESE